MKNKILRRHRINRVMNFVRYCDGEALTLNTMSDVACLSRHHFSRIFKEYCNETPVQFATRLHLEKSVSNLIHHPGMSITSIALETGFSSTQAFSNAFSRQYGLSPRSFRLRNNGYVNDFPKNQYVLSPEMSRLPKLDLSVSPVWKVELRTLPATRFAYIRTRGSYYHACPWRDVSIIRLTEWGRVRGLWNEETELIGLCPDDPAVTPPELCQYDIGIAVEHGVDEDDDISIQHLPEMTLATLHVTGSMQTARAAWKWFLSEWLPESGFQRAGWDYYEIFRLCDMSWDAFDMTGLLCVPVNSRLYPHK